MARPTGGFPRRDLLGLAAAGLLGAGALSSATSAPATAATSAPATGLRAERRIALVIGNGAYKSAPLKNPVGDAEAVAASLKQLGYEVIFRRDTGLFDLVEALREFSVRASDSAVRLLFYAGHGIQARGRNYLLPVDVEPQSEDEISAKAADVGQFIDRLSAIRHGLNIVVLDACRVNPFAGGVFVGPDGRRLKFRGVTPTGLAPLDAPVGTLVAFSTAPNGVALDGPVGAHSIYAKHLLAHLPTPGLPIEQLFKRVRIGVADETQRLQVPWESSSLTADYCFKPGTQGRCG
ncbi:caspase family protein [Aquabacterium sp.]|uniref:caspase family protein n=1 Tax=Aquabacterium sp. TaxID=1872578 RepID=UPI002BF34686|nr:caspase family protein [Aquabacterium sp.]HSW08352.1 caspase family protein [Aquabacterium sp.]